MKHIKTKIHPLPIKDQRLNIPVSLVAGAKSTNIIEQVPLKKVLNNIVDDNNTKLIDFTTKLTQSRAKDVNLYKQLKSQSCPGLIIGKYSIRKDDECEEYVPLAGFDIDGIEDEFMMELTLADCQTIPYVFLAMPSPSKRGLRIFVWTEARPKNHKAYYEFICNKLSEDLRIKTDKVIKKELFNVGKSATEIRDIIKTRERIDTGTNNLSRLWFYIHLEKDQIYLNLESEVIKMDAKTSTKVTSKMAKKPPVNAKASFSSQEKIELCEKIFKERNVSAGRNNSVYSLACIMREHGLEEVDILSHCYSMTESDFTENEIKRTVHSAIKRAVYKKYSDEQLAAYFGLTEKKPRQNKAASKEESTITLEVNKKSKFLQIKEYLQRKYQFRLNVISNEIEAKETQDKEAPYTVLNENDLICELMEGGFTSVESMLIILLRSSFVPKYNPLNNYFKNLSAWDDSMPDYIEELAGYVSAKDQEWFNYQFKKMLVRVVACGINYIKFNKHCFTLQGKQNDGKTSFLRFLCPHSLQDYFKENLDIHNKDGRLALCQNLFINLDELATFSKTDINRTKAFFTVDKVKERIVYERKPQNFPRIASFLASTNQIEILTDETGNVRWLIFEIDHIKHDNGGEYGYDKNIDIDLVYSQAFALLKNGFDFKLSPADIAKSEKNNKGYLLRTAEQELIQKYFNPSTKDEEDALFHSATDILESLKEVAKSQLYKSNIGKALKILGFEQVSYYKKEFGSSRKGYWLKETEDLIAKRFEIASKYSNN